MDDPVDDDFVADLGSASLLVELHPLDVLPKQNSARIIGTAAGEHRATDDRDDEDRPTPGELLYAAPMTRSPCLTSGPLANSGSHHIVNGLHDASWFSGSSPDWMGTVHGCGGPLNDLRAI